MGGQRLRGEDGSVTSGSGEGTPVMGTGARVPKRGCRAEPALLRARWPWSRTRGEASWASTGRGQYPLPAGRLFEGQLQSPQGGGTR